MGASSWISTVEACEDLSVALLRAKTKVFHRRAFEDPWGVVDYPEMARAFLLRTPPVPPELAKDRADIITDHLDWASPRLDALEDFLSAQNIEAKMEALRRVYGFEGTHSILDIASVQGLREVTAEELIWRFGETVPMLVRSQLKDLVPLVEARGTAVWLRYINNDEYHRTANIGFVGISGD